LAGSPYKKFEHIKDEVTLLHSAFTRVRKAQGKILFTLMIEHLNGFL
jgi:hypothetical protein